MKLHYKSLLSAAICTALVACGGSDKSDPDNSATDSSASLTADTTSQVEDQLNALLQDESAPDIGLSLDGDELAGEQSLLLEGNPSGVQDLVISDVVAVISPAANDSASGIISYEFKVNENGGNTIALDNLSVALEVAASGSFEDSYTTPLFDIREQGGSIQSSGEYALSARSTGTDLPAGNYAARLVVNPNWQNAFDFVPADNGIQAFHFADELDYKNNASEVFQVNVRNTIECSEDGFENNDSLSTATAVPAGGQISASLCLDDVDFYSVQLAEDDVTSLSFDYTDVSSNPNPATQYVVFDSSFNRITEATVARESNRIVINSTAAGQYYLALFGKRASYRMTRVDGAGLADDFTNDNFFHTDVIPGPHSWLTGAVTLNRLAFTETLLNEQVVNCGRITTQFQDNQPVAYVTPDHFADIHEFRFLAGGDYLIDDELESGWRVVDGDISNRDWYSHSYPGYAERVSDNSWSYWTDDGLSYVECTLEVNR